MQGGRVRIMLVDENPGFLRLMNAFLRRRFEVVAAVPAFDIGWIVAQAQQLRPQAIVIGLATRYGAGLEVISAVRAKQPRVGIIALVPPDSEGSRLGVLTSGADELLARYSLDSDLVSAIQRLANSESDEQVVSI